MSSNPPPKYIAADDDDDIDESAIPGYTVDEAPALSSADKGKARATEVLAAPSSASSSAAAAAAPLSGRIGTSPNPAKGVRQTIGGVRVETR